MTSNQTHRARKVIAVIHELNNAKLRTQDGWLRSLNSSSVLCYAFPYYFEELQMKPSSDFFMTFSSSSDVIKTNFKLIFTFWLQLFPVF